MSERPNDAADHPEEPGAEPPIEEAASDLAAVSDLAPEDEAGAEPAEIDDEDDALSEEAAAEEEALLEEEAAAEEERAEDEAATIAAVAEVERTRSMRPGERRALRTAGQTQIPIDPSLRI
jgi:hypothetical protein